MSLELLRPVPDLSGARMMEKGYRLLPINSRHPLHYEPLVAIADYGIAGQAYYSRANSALDAPVPGVSPHIYVRKTVAEKLAVVNHVMQTSDEVARIAGGRIELNLREGFRSPKLQAYLHSTVIPEFLRAKYPAWSEEKVRKRRDMFIAAPPSPSLTSPSPHATGGAFDTSIQYLGSDKQVFTGYGEGMDEDAVFPDFLERIDEADIAMFGLTKEAFSLARDVRRITCNLMANPEIGGVSAAVNPVEVWHYSFGDQLWAQQTGLCAVYGYPGDENLPAALRVDTVAAAASPSLIVPGAV